MAGSKLVLLVSTMVVLVAMSMATPQGGDLLGGLIGGGNGNGQFGSPNRGRGGVRVGRGPSSGGGQQRIPDFAMNMIDQNFAKYLPMIRQYLPPNFLELTGRVILQRVGLEKYISRLEGIGK